MAGKKRYLVAADGSAGSKSVVRYVASMLSPVNTEVAILHVLNRLPEAYWDFGMGIEVDALSSKLKKQVEEHEGSIKAFMAECKQMLMEANFREENIAIYIKDRVAGIARDIMAEARRGYNGLMMGSTGVGGMKGATIGSVSAKIIGALADVPMCIVAGKPDGRNFIVALDGSEGSMRALDYTCSLVNGFKGNVVLFHATRHLSYPNGSTISKANLGEVEKAIWQDVKKMLGPTVAEAKKRLIKAGSAKEKVTTNFVTGVSSRAGALLEAARQSGCGSVIVGRTGISQVEDFNIGRVANKVVQGAQDQAVWIIP